MKIIVYLIFTVFLVSCCETKNRQEEKKQQALIYNDSTSQLIVDSIIYDVIIKPPAEPLTWQDISLEDFNRKLFIDLLFRGIESGKLKASNYSTLKPLSAKRIKEMEKAKEIIREQITRVQFNESWQIDSSELKIKKKVNSIILGQELYNSDGEVKGYKAVFRIDFD